MQAVLSLLVAVKLEALNCCDLKAKYGVFLKYGGMVNFRACHAPAKGLRHDRWHSPRYQDETAQPFAFNNSNHLEDCWGVDRL